jgi:hypothetical protein
MTVRTRGVIAEPSAPLGRRPTRRALIGFLLVALTAASFLVGRRTAPSHRHPLVGSLDRSFDVTVGPCTKEPTSVGKPGFKVLATINWRSGWKDNEFPFDNHGLKSNVHIGMSWDHAVWTFGDVKPEGSVSQYSVGPAFTPSRKAAGDWATRAARRRGVLDSLRFPELLLHGPNSYGVLVVENYYDQKSQARWVASLTAYEPLGVKPKPSTATFAMFDVDGSVIEKTVDIPSCT